MLSISRRYSNHEREEFTLSKNEREEVQNFVEDQLRKGYIRPSKSPQMSPVFFVGKKDGSKWMVMNYCNLNDQTVKNNYLLPLITELIDNMGSKKVFTKMDLRWGFNNVRIKEGDECYESPKQEKVSHAFEHLIQNLKAYNRVRI